MKIVGDSVLGSKSQSHAPILTTLKRDQSWMRDLKAQDKAIAMLERSLDNRYYLIRNANLEGLDIPIPLILAGPTGLWVLYPTALRGVFRAKGDSWEQMDERSNNFRPCQPNLLSRALLIAQAVEKFLAEHGFSQIKVEAAIIFVHPGVHVEMQHPAVRIVLLDALERFVNKVQQGPLIINWKDTRVFVSLLSKVDLDEESSSVEEIKDEFSFKDEQAKPLKLPEISIPYPPDEKVVKAIKKVPFNTKQLLVLGFLLGINILILMAFVVVILIFS